MKEKIIHSNKETNTITKSNTNHRQDLIQWFDFEYYLKNKLPLDTPISIKNLQSLWIINSSLYQQWFSNIIFEKAKELNIKIEFIDQEWIIQEKALWIFDNLDKKAILHIPKLIESFKESEKTSIRWEFLQCKEANQDLMSFFNYVINHELLHGLTMDKYTDLWINTRKWVYKGKLCNEQQLNGLVWLSRVFNYLQSVNQKEIFWWKEYWMENLAEFMAECCNESFLWRLKNIKLPDNITKSSTYNIFQNILQYIYTKEIVENNIANYILHCLSDIIS